MTTNPKTSSKPRCGWRRALKWTAVAAGSLVALAVVATAVAVWVLSPETLTPMVEKYSSDYLDAKVTARRVELTFWKTFPKVQVDVEGLTVVSDALRDITPQQRAQLPADADTLLTMQRFSGGINVWAATMGYLMLYDVEIDAPRVNLVKVTGDAPISFFSLSDSIDAAISIVSTTLDGAKAPVYTLSARGGGGGRLAPFFELPPLKFGIDGTIKWNQHQPDHINLSDFTFDVGGNILKMNADVSFSESVLLHELDLYAVRLKTDDVVRLIPDDYKGELARIKSDAEVDLTARLLKPYDVGQLSDSVPGLPHLELTLKIPGGSLEYGRLNLRRMKADVTATIDGDNPDGSSVDIRELELQGGAVGFSLAGTVTHPLSDPRISGEFDGRIDFSALPVQLLQRLPFAVRGRLSGQTNVRMRLSDIDPKRFHNMRADGSVRLDDFLMRMRDSSALAYVSHAQLKFGTSNKMKLAGGATVDSLLQIGLTSDTLAFVADGIAMLSRGLKIGMGTRNDATTLDTTVITPLGFTASAQRIAFRSDSDSTRIVLRDADIKALLQRFEGGARDPLLTVGLTAGRLRYTDLYNRMSLTDATADMSLHPRKRVRRRMAISAADSLQRSARLRLRIAQADSANAGKEMMDFDVDRGIVSWMRRWNASAHVKAAGARMMTPYFPVRNRITGLDLEISTDSVVIRDTRYRMGKSDFLLNGTISNITRALSSRRGSPLEMDFTIKSDTIDINNITAAILAGSVFAEKRARGEAMALSAATR